MARNFERAIALYQLPKREIIVSVQHPFGPCYRWSRTPLELGQIYERSIDHRHWENKSLSEGPRSASPYRVLKEVGARVVLNLLLQRHEDAHQVPQGGYWYEVIAD